MTQKNTFALSALQAAAFAAALLLSSPLAGLVDSAMNNLSPTEKSDMEITLTDQVNRTVIFKS